MLLKLCLFSDWTFCKYLIIPMQFIVSKTFVHDGTLIKQVIPIYISFVGKFFPPIILSPHPVPQMMKCPPLLGTLWLFDKPGKGM